MKLNEKGLTLVELMVAVVILAIGLLMLAGGALAVTRNLTRSGLSTVATARAQAKLDELRAIAASTVPNCTSASFDDSGASVTISKVTLSWTINPKTGSERLVRVVTSYALPGGMSHTDTLRGVIGC